MHIETSNYRIGQPGREHHSPHLINTNNALLTKLISGQQHFRFSNKTPYHRGDDGTRIAQNAYTVTKLTPYKGATLLHQEFMVNPRQIFRKSGNAKIHMPRPGQLIIQAAFQRKSKPGYINLHQEFVIVEGSQYQVCYVAVPVDITKELASFLANQGHSDTPPNSTILIIYGQDNKHYQLVTGLHLPVHNRRSYVTENPASLLTLGLQVPEVQLSPELLELTLPDETHTVHISLSSTPLIKKIEENKPGIQISVSKT